MARIFISYSRRSSKMAEKLAARLRIAGHHPWIDSAEILVGDSIAETIERGIQRCDFLCFLITKTSLKSTWAREEVSSALNRQIGAKSIVVLPLLADKSMGAKDLPPFLAGKKYADFRGSFERGFQDLLQAINTRSAPSLDSKTDITVFLHDLMETAIASVRDKFPQYQITAIRDRDDATRDWLGCSGDPRNCDIEWQFDLEKIGSDSSRVRRLKVHVHPIWDILLEEFPEVEEIMLWTTEKVKESVYEKVKTIAVPEIECTALDAEVILFKV